MNNYQGFARKCIALEHIEFFEVFYLCVLISQKVIRITFAARLLSLTDLRVGLGHF